MLRISCEKRKVNKCVSFCLAGCMCLGLLTGCNNNRVDYNLNAETEEGGAAESEEALTSLSQLAEAERWEEDLEGTWEDGSTGTVHINTAITVPDAEYMSVIEVRKKEFDAAYKEQLVKAVFGEAQVYYKDDEAEENTQIPVTDYEGNAYEGKRNQVSYALDMEDNTGVINKECGFSMYPKEKIAPESLPAELRSLEDVFFLLYGQSTTDISGEDENFCELTQEEAQSTADDFLEEIGINSMILTEALPLCWIGQVAGEDGTAQVQGAAVDGYIFHYELGIDNLSLKGFGVESDYTIYQEWTWANLSQTPTDSLRAEANLYVTEDGVIQIDMDNPVEITTVTREVEMLPLQKIQNIMKNELSGNLSQLSFSADSLRLDSMELIYFRIRNRAEEGCYSYVPAWRLCKKDTYGTACSNSVLVNAIDGSVIDLVSELSGRQKE